VAYVGIDLGTTNSAIAVKEHGEPVRALRIEQEGAESQELIRSVVGWKDGQYLRSWMALSDAPNNPQNAIFSIKRLMGRGYDDRHPGYDETDPKRGRLIRELVRERWGYEVVRPSGGTEHSVAVRLGGREYSPQEISAQILIEAKRIAEEQLGQEVEGAVITVPAYFDEKQKWATREAAKLAGLPVQKILDEPTAAAIAFGVATLTPGVRTVLVYDLGGGTLDVSLGDVIGADFEAETIDGDNWLGGDDFDKKIADHLLIGINRRTGIDLQGNQAHLFLVRERAREAKERLSKERKVSVHLEDLLPDSPEVSLTRAEFEAMVSDDVAGSLRLVERALRRRSMVPEDVDAVLLVGGSTKIPLIRRKLAEMFGTEKVSADVDPMLCVALGAAIKSYWLAGKIECPWCGYLNESGTERCVRGGGLLPIARRGGIAERPYGVAAYDEQSGRRVFDVIIPKDEPYPLKRPATRTYYTPTANARILVVRSYGGLKDGDRDYRSEPERNIPLSTVWMPLPPGLPAGTPIEVSLSINDVSGVMDDITIQCGGQTRDTPVISRHDQLETLAMTIEEQLKTIQLRHQQRTLKGKAAKQLVDQCLAAMQLVSDSTQATDAHAIEEMVAEAKQRTEQVADLLDRYDDGEGDKLEESRGALKLGLFVLGEYRWVLDLRAIDIASIREVLEELEELVSNGRVEDAEICALKLKALLADPALGMLLQMRSTEAICSSLGTPRGHDNARQIQAKRAIMEEYIKTGRLEEAQDLHAEIWPLVLWCLERIPEDERPPDWVIELTRPAPGD
jgi:molecular chaperone DnaK (HSP70)